MPAFSQWGCVIAAPQSGSGKTTLTLGLLRALKRQGINLAPAKAGPDFIDPAFHAAASGSESVNLDPWAMRSELIHKLANQPDKFLLIEAMMGLFDGAADGTGSAADLAKMLDLPVVMVMDAAKQSHSVAALVSGFRNHRADINVCGVILNRVGSARHEAMLRDALNAIDVSVLGAIYRNEKLALPSRHLGLVQAHEHVDLQAFVNHAADVVEKSIDMDALLALGGQGVSAPEDGPTVLPLGQRIAVARDTAFAFAYPHLLQNWRDAGVELSFFSPLADETPRANCDAVYLPGGYPELHAPLIASNKRFLAGLVAARDKGACIYGECGGYMVLGEGLVDAEGIRHKMANLLPLTTSFAERKLHLGYRKTQLIGDAPLGAKSSQFTAHEFHYSTVVNEGDAPRLFSLQDAREERFADAGLHISNVMGSYMHLIDRSKSV